MTAPRACRRRGLQIGLAAGFLGAMLLSLGACSSNSPSDEVSASAAADTVADVFALPVDQRDCLEEHFDDRAEARQVFSGQDVASAGDLLALGEVEAACIPTGTLAAAITNAVDDGFGGSLTDAQRTCLTDRVMALEDDDRDKLLVGLVVSTTGALDDAGLAEMGEVTNGLLQACQLDLSTTQTSRANG